MKARIRVVWFLYVLTSFIELASSATLVCDEKEGTEDDEVSCQLEMGYEEIAKAWNLNCEPSENGLKCQFEAKRDTKTTVLSVTSRNAGVKGCSDKEGVCVTSNLQTHLTPTKRVGSTTTQEEAQKGTAEPEPVEQPLPDGIRVGYHVYKEPYNQYAKPIERTLLHRAQLFRSTPKDVGTEYALANAHLDIGISHFTAVTEEDYSPGMHSTDSTQESFDLKLAVNAFRGAEKLYFQILQKYDREKATIYKSLGALYLQWGEVYQNSHYFDDEVEDEDQVEEFNKLALKQYQQSEKYYRLALEQQQEKERLPNEDNAKDIQINLAHVSHRIGRCLINSIEGTAVMAEDLDLDHTELDQALPQLTTLLHTVPKAEEKFAEAIRLYRVAIDEEMDLDSQIRLKMNLVSSLQDGGTAASYASNLPKALQYQEEGVAIGKELLPHVGTSDRLYLQQYVADSMYGQASYHMQLGKYDNAKATYTAAMEWYAQHNLNPASTVAGYPVSDESLEAYEKQLSDYHDLVREVTMPDGYMEDGPMYGPNHAYEADLHAALGSLHLSREEVLMAIDHFNQAIRLYQQNESDENLDRSIADVQVSLAAALFKDGDFANSEEAHNEAMDIYKTEVGEGNNPILAGLADKLGGSIDVNEVIANSDIGGLMGASDLQELLAGLGVDTSGVAEKLEEVIEKAQGSAEAKNQNKNEEDSAASESNKGEEKSEKPTKKVHEQLIDPDIIEKVRQSILTNATSMKGEL